MILLSCRAALLSVLVLASTCLAASPRRPARETVPAAGEAIYQKGELSLGSPLRGERDSAPAVEGAAAACANCHRRSGLGELEGRVLVPPITGRYLYHARGHDAPANLESAARTMAAPGARVELLQQGDRSAYTDGTLARAIRQGITPDGRRLGFLMPRFRIDDADMASLIAYLKQLSGRPSPGVGDETLQFATIITPDADPIKRRGMLDVLEHFFGKQNVFSGGKSPPAQLSRRFTPIAHRWQLHVWELTGAPESWEAQLTDRLGREPVFAAISGVGGSTWEPVHRFCQRSGLPCLFPNVDLPVVAEDDFYVVYLSKGVLLEAQLIADRLRQPDPGSAQGAGPRRRLVQVYRNGDIGEQAARALRNALPSTSIEAVDRALKADTETAHLREAVANALADSRPDDALVLWMRPAELQSLPGQPPEARAVFVSGIMGGLELAPLAAPWRQVATMTYPFDLPDQRRIRMDYPFGWMRLKQIPLVDERTQTDTYLACLIVAETASMIGQDLVRDHLLETLELHVGTRVVNGYYPRLGLAAGQRFVSKGGFLVRFADAQGVRLVAAGDWSVP